MQDDALKKEWCKAIYPYIEHYCALYGYKYPMAILAQAAKESAWGQSRLAYKYYNYFGMKCGSSWIGKSVNMQTKEEYVAGQLTTIRDNFRVYDDMESGVRGFFEFIGYSRYSNLILATSELNWFELLQEDGYFTSKTYVSTIQVWIDQCRRYVEDNTVINNTVKANPLNEYVLKCLKRQIDDVAELVRLGSFGNGEDRKAALGVFYDIVQSRINGKW